MTHRLYFDGSSLSRGRKGGPGPSSGAALLIDPFDAATEHSVYLARADLNEAEFWGLICGLTAAKKLGVSDLSIFGDSRTVIDALLFKKTLENPRLLLLNERARLLLNEFQSSTLDWLPRRKNGLADGIARSCLLKRRGTYLPEAAKAEAIC